MSHYLMLVVLAICVAVVFALVTKDSRQERLHYLLTMLAYMVVGSLLGGWVMSLLLP